MEELMRHKPKEYLYVFAAFIGVVLVSSVVGMGLGILLMDHPLALLVLVLMGGAACWGVKP